MSKLNKVIGVSYKGVCYPIAVITGTELQIVIRFINTRIHWTIHEKDQQNLLFNPSDKNFHSTWSDERVHIAKSFGYTDPEKHGQYIFQNLLDRNQNHCLGEITLNLREDSRKKRYLKSVESIGRLNTKNFRLKIDLKINTDYSSFSFPTSLGHLVMSSPDGLLEMHLKAG